MPTEMCIILNDVKHVLSEDGLTALILAEDDEVMDEVGVHSLEEIVKLVAQPIEFEELVNLLLVK